MTGTGFFFVVLLVWCYRMPGLWLVHGTVSLCWFKTSVILIGIIDIIVIGYIRNINLSNAIFTRLTPYIDKILRFITMDFGFHFVAH
jgi:hypothetical protein